MTPQDYRRLVAGTISRYWAPLFPPEVPDDGQADDIDYGQADHILAALLSAGLVLPGLPPDTFVGLVPSPETVQDQPGNPAADNPLLSVSLLLPRSMINRLKALGDAAENETWQAVMRRFVVEGIETAERAAGESRRRHDG